MKTFWSTERVPAALWVCLVLLVALCGVSLSSRYKVEQANKAVGLVVESDVVRQLAAAENMTAPEAFALLKKKGINGLVMGEETVAMLEAEGYVSFMPGGIGVRKEALERVEAALQVQYPQVKKVSEDLGYTLFDLNGVSKPSLRAMMVGVDRFGAGMASWAQVFAVVRIPNPDSARNHVVSWLVEEAQGVSKETKFFLPMGDQVLGKSGGLETLREELVKRKIFYASAEFAKVAGDSQIVAAIPEHVVRLHTAQGADLDKLTPASYVERYAKAVSERGQRLLLLRPLTKVSDSPLSDFARLVERLKGQIQHEGYTIAEPHPYQSYEVSRFIPILMGIVSVPLVGWLASAMLGARWAIPASVLWLLLSLAAYIAFGRQLLALGLAIGMPIFGFVALEKLRLKMIAGYVFVSALSTIGGLCVAAILNSTDFLVRADTFSGVKIAIFLPVFIVLAYFLSRSEEGKRVVHAPISWIGLVGFGAVMGLLLFVMSRTGNDNPAGVSGIELQVRSMLENWLPVRPRTKEFLFGHPMLMIGLGLFATKSARNKLASAFCFAAGALGQTSIVNTMCHLHTPLTIGLLRIVVGLVIGGILGLIFWGGFRRFAAEK